MINALTLPLLLDTKEVCAALHVSRTTLWEMEKRRELPAAIYLNRRCKRWRASDLEAFIQKQEEVLGLAKKPQSSE